MLSDGAPGLHPVLGAVDVRLLLLLQHHRSAQHADRYDVLLLPVHLGQVRQASLLTAE